MDSIKAVLAKLSAKEVEYVMERSRTRSDRAAYLAVGLPKGTFFKWSQERRDYLNDVAARIRSEVAVRAILVLQDSAEEAARIKADGLKSRNEHIRQTAASDILDRTIGKATQRIETEVSGEQTVKVKIITGGASYEDI